jgi:glutamyl-tRNA synthetase
MGPLGVFYRELAGLEDWSAGPIHEIISRVATSHGLSLGKLAQPVRIAVCGGTVSPPIDATLAILGKDEALRRLAAALEAWSSAAGGSG